MQRDTSAAGVVYRGMLWGPAARKERENEIFLVLPKRTWFKKSNLSVLLVGKGGRVGQVECTTMGKPPPCHEERPTGKVRGGSIAMGWKGRAELRPC